MESSRSDLLFVDTVLDKFIFFNNQNTLFHCFTFIPKTGSCHKRQKPQAPTPQAPVRNHQTRKVANAKCINRNTNLT